MTLPGAERAVVDVKKLRDYCLSPAHPRGRHKARVFASALRLFRDDAEWLKAKLLNAAMGGDATEAEQDEYGYRYVLDFDCERNGTCASAAAGSSGEARISLGSPPVMYYRNEGRHG
jgi:hypothetical protein